MHNCISAVVVQQNVQSARENVLYGKNSMYWNTGNIKVKDTNLDIVIIQ